MIYLLGVKDLVYAVQESLKAEFYCDCDRPNIPVCIGPAYSPQYRGDGV